MLYQCTLTIPANTLVTAPESDILKLAAGVSTRREVYFPVGCQGTAKVRIFHGGWQIVPWSRDEWLHSNDETVVDESPYPVPLGLNSFTIYAYNEDTVNSHTIQVRVQMREGEAVEFLQLGRFLDVLRGY